MQNTCPPTTEPSTSEPQSTPTPGQCPSEESYSPCKCRGDVFDDLALLLDCDEHDLDDQRVSEILTAFLNDQNADPLRVFRAEYNQLTKIPDEIKLFPQLQQLYLYSNNIEIISTGSLTFNAAESIVGLGYSVKTIEPGAFVGWFYIYKLFI